MSTVPVMVPTDPDLVAIVVELQRQIDDLEQSKREVAEQLKWIKEQIDRHETYIANRLHLYD